MNKGMKAAVLISGLIVGCCAVVGMVYLFNRPGFFFKICGLVAVLAMLLFMWWLIHSLEE